MSAAALAGWVVLGVSCVAALALMGAGALRVVFAQRELKRSLARIEETKRLTFDAARFEAAFSRISRDVALAAELVQRGRRALRTVGTAARYAIAAVRLLRYVR